MILRLFTPPPRPYTDVLPESEGWAFVYRTAAVLSLAMYVTLAAIVFYKRLWHTTLMKQVFCLCTCDFVVMVWEIVSCTSWLHFVGFCWSNCQYFDAVLRTLQMASSLWATQIAVGVAFVMNGRMVPFRRLMQNVWPMIPLSALLCCLSWIQAFRDEWLHVNDTSPYCENREGTMNANAPYTFFVLLCLLVIVAAYANTCWRLYRLSSEVVRWRKLRRAVSYIMVFLVCYMPYALVQGFNSTEEMYGLMRTSVAYRVIYLLYSLVGAGNVAAYGFHHWDTGWFRRAYTAPRQLAGQEIRVVMFASRVSRPGTSGNTSVLTSGLTSSDDRPSTPLQNKAGQGDFPVVTPLEGTSVEFLYTWQQHCGTSIFAELEQRRLQAGASTAEWLSGLTISDRHSREVSPLIELGEDHFPLRARFVMQGAVAQAGAAPTSLQDRSKLDDASGDVLADASSIAASDETTILVLPEQRATMLAAQLYGIV